ncbi:MAG: META domain-containing protein [Actinomycetota bacterium]|nr:META domain-containing protein [Actinomycetota bacterium]
MNQASMKVRPGGIGSTLTATLAALTILAAVFLLPSASAGAATPVPAATKAQPTKSSGLYGSLFRTPAAGDLLGHSYVSTGVKGKKMHGKKVRIRFFRHSPEAGTPKKPTLSASAGCNSFGAAFTIRNGRLRWNGPVTSTAMGCPKVNHDPWLSRLLTRGMNAELKGKRLVLTRGKTRITLRRTV